MNTNPTPTPSPSKLAAQAETPTHAQLKEYWLQAIPASLSDSGRDQVATQIATMQLRLTAVVADRDEAREQRDLSINSNAKLRKERDVHAAELTAAIKERDEACRRHEHWRLFAAFFAPATVKTPPLEIPDNDLRQFITDSSTSATRTIHQFTDEVHGLQEQLTQLRAENERLRLANGDIAALQASIADFVNIHARECGAGESPNYQAGNIKDAIDRVVYRHQSKNAELAQQLTHLKAELERANGIIANLSREKNETKNDIPDDEIVRREFDKLRLEQERNRIRYPAH